MKSLGKMLNFVDMTWAQRTELRMHACLILLLAGAVLDKEFSVAPVHAGRP